MLTHSWVFILVVGIGMWTPGAFKHKGVEGAVAAQLEKMF
jgi:hypothetical protein